MANKGTKYERKLVKGLESEGIPAFRFWGSGAGHDRPSPDVWVKSGEDYITGEVKFSSDGYCYIEAEEIQLLLEFAEKWDTVPMAIARFSGDTNYYCINLTESDVEKHTTDSGNLSMKESKKNQYDILREVIADG